MGTILILGLICKLLGKDVKWVRMQLGRFWRFVMRPFQKGENRQNDNLKSMKKNVKIYLISALVSLVLLVAYVLFFIIGNQVVTYKLENYFYKTACSELQLELPEIADIITEEDLKELSYCDWSVEHHIKFAEPLSEQVINLIEHRCADPERSGWEQEAWSDWYGQYYYNYDDFNDFWRYESNYSLSDTDILVSYSIREFALGPFWLSAIWGVATLLWIVVVTIWGLTMLVSHCVRKCKNRDQNLQ